MPELTQEETADRIVDRLVQLLPELMLIASSLNEVISKAEVGPPGISGDGTISVQDWIRLRAIERGLVGLIYAVRDREDV